MLDKLEIDKTKLEQMKVVLGKYRIKDDTSGVGGSFQIQQLQSKIEAIAATLANRYTQLEECEATAKQAMEENANSLVERIEKEKEILDEHITKVLSASLMNRDTKEGDAIKELKNLKKKYDETLEKITNYQSYEETLGTEERVPVPQIEIFNKLFTNVIQVCQTYGQQWMV